MKKVMAIVVGLALVLAMAGCGESGGQPDGDGGTSTSADAASVDTSSATNPPEPEIEYVEPPAEDFGYEYDEELDGVVITGYHGEDTAIRIPSEIDGYAVKVIGTKAFSHNPGNNHDLITNIIIPDGVIIIGSYAFTGCSSLTSITIPGSVEAIYNSAFEFCTGLTSVTILDGVTVISSSFGYCTSLTSVTIPDSVAVISSYAFEFCTSLTSLTIPDSVEEIGEYAFLGCANLAITYKGKIYTSEDDRFYRELFSYEYLEELDGVAIYQYVGSGTSVRIPSEIDGYTVKSVNFVFVNHSVEHIELPDSITEINIVFIPNYGYVNSGFACFSKLKSITIPDSVTVIVSNAFRTCTSLTSLTIPDSVTEIGEHIFVGCDDLTVTYKGETYTIANDPYGWWKE